MSDTGNLVASLGEGTQIGGPAPTTKSVRRSTRRRTGLWLVARQVAFSLATLLVISMITFAFTGSKPAADVAVNALGNEASPAQLQRYIHDNGLDRPLPARYLSWLGDFARGDWGTSLTTRRPVRPEISHSIGPTLLIATGGLLLGVPIAVSLGILMARHARSALDLGLVTASTVLAAIPEFVLAISLILLFGVALGWLPVDNAALTFGTTWEKVKTYILPIVTLALMILPYVLGITRASVREALNAPFARAAVLRGLSRRTVLWDHVMRNAAIPIVTSIALSLVYLLGGVIVVEQVFGLPGLGSQLVEAVKTGDAPTVQAIALLLGAMFVTIAFVVDLLALYFDPRLRSR